MAQLLLAVGGAAVGSQFGVGPVGWVAGAMLGGWLFSPHQTMYGPRVTDNKVQTADYGTPLPIGYGTHRWAGSVIWSTELNETVNKKKVGGKGGASATQITYTYSKSFAVAFAGRTAYDLLQLYCDGKLIYDITNSGDLKTNVTKPVRFKFYKGTETQEPDSTIESIKGVGNATAYRGIVYVVFEDFDLTEYGGRIPLIEATISFNGAVSYPSERFWPTNAGITYPGTNCFIRDPIRPYIYVVGGNKISKFNITTNAEVAYNTLSISLNSTTLSIDPEGFIWCQDDVDTKTDKYYKIDPNTLEIIDECGLINQWNASAWWCIQAHSISIAANMPQFVGYEKVLIVASYFYGGRIDFISRNLMALDTSDLQPDESLDDLRYLGRISFNSSWFGGGYSPIDVVVDKDSIIWVLGIIGATGASSGAGLYRVSAILVDNSDQDTYFGTPKVVTGAYGIISLTAYLPHGPSSFIYYPDDHSLIIFASKQTYDYDGIAAIKWDIEDMSVIATATSTDIPNYPQFRTNSRIGVQNGNIIIASHIGATILKASTLEVIYGPYSWSNWGTSYGGIGDIYWDDESKSIWRADNSSVFGSPYTHDTILRCYLDRLTGLPETLDDVITDMAVRSKKLVAADIDVTDLTAINVYGYLIGRQMSAKSAIMPLLLGYFVNGVESDWKIKFNLLGDASSFTIDEDDLGVESDVKNSEIQVEESQLPKEFDVVFIDRQRAYQQNVARHARHADTVKSTQVESIELAIDLTPSEAKQIAAKYLYHIWNERVGHELRLGPNYMLIDPSDVGTLTIGTTSYTVRVVKATVGSGLGIELQVSHNDPDNYTSLLEGFGGSTLLTNTLQLVGPTELIPLNTNLLRDFDDYGGSAPTLYFAACSYLTGWRGAVIFKSQDNKLYDEIATALHSVTWGHAMNALGTSNQWATWERYKYLDVSLVRGTLESKTELQVLNGSNAALLKCGTGWEVIQFTTATLTGTNLYRLTNLLRGRRGSNYFIDGHVAGDTFILLDAYTILKHNLLPAEINAHRYYKGVSIGSHLEDAPVVDVASIGEPLMPYSPCYIFGTRDGSNNLTVTWKRRTRIAGDWVNASGTVILGESSESYDIEIIGPTGTVLRNIVATSPTITYSAADQTSDGLTPGDPVSLIIYQISAIVDRGYGTEAIV